VLLQLRARHDVSGPLDEQRQHARRLRLEPRRHTGPADLAGLHVELDVREPKKPGLLCHTIASRFGWLSAADAGQTPSLSGPSRAARVDASARFEYFSSVPFTPRGTRAFR
jgi:hypothetical protein